LKLKALKEIYQKEEFQDLAVLFKRVTQILKNVDVTSLCEVDPGLFQEEEEKVLYERIKEYEPRLKEYLEKKNYKLYLETLLHFKPLIDAFFDRVFVMVEDEALRNNRLSLLNMLARWIYSFGDLSYLA